MGASWREQASSCEGPASGETISWFLGVKNLLLKRSKRKRACFCQPKGFMGYLEIQQSQSCPIKQPHDKSWESLSFPLSSLILTMETCLGYTFNAVCVLFTEQEGFWKTAVEILGALVGISFLFFFFVYYFLLSQISMLLAKASPICNSYNFLWLKPIKSNCCGKMQHFRLD